VILPPVVFLPKKDEPKIGRNANVSKEVFTVSCVVDVKIVTQSRQSLALN
jgi:hypothetical protein